MSKLSGIGIIGTGVIFREHVNALRSLQNRLRLIGVAELNDEKRHEMTEKDFIPIATADYHQLLARDDVHIVSICTPPNTHEKIAIDALEAGKHVICEKPLAHTLASADRIIAAAEKASGKLCAVYQLRFLPEILKTIALRDQGLLGPLTRGSVTTLSNLDGSEAIQTGWWGRWGVSGGGLVMTRFIHQLDLLIHVFGTPIKVTASLDALKFGDLIESEDTFSATIEFESGAVVECYSSGASEKGKVHMQFIAENASIQMPWQLECADSAHLQRVKSALAHTFPQFEQDNKSLPHRLLRKAGRMCGLIENPKQSNYHYGTLHAQLFNQFLDAIDNDTESPVSGRAARQSLELCIAIYWSGISGESVTLPLGNDCPIYDGVTADDFANRKSTSCAAVGEVA